MGRQCILDENADKVIDRINESFASRAEAVSLGSNYVLILLCENHYSGLSYIAEGIYYILTGCMVSNAILLLAQA